MKKNVLILLGCYLLALVISVTSLIATATIAIKNPSNFLSSSRNSNLLHASSTSTSTLTLNLLPDMVFVKEVSSFLTSHRDLILWLTSLRHNTFDEHAHSLSISSSSRLDADITSLYTHCQKTVLIKKVNNGIVCSVLSTADKYSLVWDRILRKISEQNQTYLILLQNSEEIRASGGFMGSYARLTVGKNGITELGVQDIYEPDGQFTGYIEPPPGLAEYLSSGNGMRLPDANWHPDFPTAAQTILSYFSLGSEQDVDGVIAINSSLVEKILAVSGDIYIPDYQTNVSADTLTTLARADRGEFFPGSKQKQHFLQALLNQLKIRAQELSPKQQKQLLAVLQDAISSKDVLFYSSDEEIQQQLELLDLAGSLPSGTTSDFFYLLESNVGINKANKAVSRSVELSVSDYQIEVRIDFRNQNPVIPPPNSADDNLNYANYIRAVVPPTWQLETATTDQREIDTWSERILATANGTYKEVGFLHIVPAKQDQQVGLLFSTPQAQIDQGFELLLLKQPGMSPTPFVINHQQSIETIILEEDTLVSFPLL